MRGFLASMMRSAARFQRHHAARMCGKEVEQLAAREPAAEHRPPGRISPVRVENMLGDVQADRGNL
jgi:hypothetical protein